MPFDPAWPQNGQNIDADRFRGQFAGLIDLINQASSITSVVVDAVNTLPPGNPATVSVNVVGTALHFTFGIPQGNAGDPGPQGPAFSTAVVDSVTTLNPGDPATVSVGFDGSSVHFAFAIPRGNDGNQGAQGEAGSQGPPGEVTNADLNTALQATLNQTSNVSNAVTTLDTPLAHPDMDTLRLKLNDLILALRR